MKLVYENSLCGLDVLSDWIKEGNVAIEESADGVILSNLDDEKLGDYAHWTIWIPDIFPKNVQIEWDFKPLREPGLCMVFFAAKGRNGESIFSSKLAKRSGYYPEYHSGDIDAYHISYFRHKYESERRFRTCNLRKSYGFHFVTQGADPLPPIEDVRGVYHLKVVKKEQNISFFIDDLKILEWYDDGLEFGAALTD
uniref:DUF1961 family protein n=1 Tax=Streptococcus merionis TaxID=400065 RepID=UPI0026E94CFB